LQALEDERRAEVAELRHSLAALEQLIRGPYFGSFPGEIRMFVGSTAPDGWALCDGAALSRATCAALFAVIGTTYGCGDGSTTFNVPNLKGRVALGAGESTASGHTSHPLGQAAGEETHTLSVTEIPAHTHTQDPHMHDYSANERTPMHFTVAGGAGSGNPPSVRITLVAVLGRRLGLPIG